METILKNHAEKNLHREIHHDKFLANENRNRAIKNELLEFSKSEEWQKELFPSECILRDRAASDEESQKHSKAIFEKTENILKEIFERLK